MPLAMSSKSDLESNGTRLNLPEDLSELLDSAVSLRLVGSIAEMAALALGGQGADSHEVVYKLPDGNEVLEATVARVRNGIVVNYPEPYMRRRDPDTMVIADDKPTDKPRYRERFGKEFGPLRRETFDWLAAQDLVVVPFHAGRHGMGLDAIAVLPLNAAFFGCALGLLQGFIPPDKIPKNFSPRAVIYIAPPFRHTHFGGKQVVVHHRGDPVHEMFCFNLYPGPSAKKGIYGILIDLGEAEGWVTAHCSTVR